MLTGLAGFGVAAGAASLSSRRRVLLDSRFEDLNGDVDNLRTDVRQMNDRLRNVEIAFSKVDQRLLTLERAVIPAAESNE